MTYNTQLQIGKEFEDFAMYQLYKMGIPISMFTSQKYQHIGESLAGVEIKFDGKMADTGNLYFETHEKTRADMKGWTQSGILRKDNTWLFCIGDYSKLYLIGKKQLVIIYERYCNGGNGAKTFTIRSTETSRGFTLSCEYVEKYLAIKIIGTNNMEKIA